MTTTNTSRPASGDTYRCLACNQDIPILEQPAHNDAYHADSTTETRAGVLLGEWKPITRETYWRLRDQHRADLTVWAEHNIPGREDYVAEAFRTASVPFIDFRSTIGDDLKLRVEFRRFTPAPRATTADEIRASIRRHNAEYTGPMWTPGPGHNYDDGPEGASESWHRQYGPR